MSKLIIKTFVFNDLFYRHELDSETDNIQLTSEDDKVLVTYTSDCCINIDQKYVGRLGMNNLNYWVATMEDGMHHQFGTRLLEAEVEYSKIFLKKFPPIAPAPDPRFHCPKCHSNKVMLRPMYGSVSVCQVCKHQWKS
jgi:DNA-directed RNA polymerase subunit M/transcription elongation factor TFIIS